MSIITSALNSVADSISSGLLSQSKKEAKRLLKIVDGNPLSINNLSEAQELVAKMKGKTSWHDLVVSVSKRSELKLKPTSLDSIIMDGHYKPEVGDMLIGFDPESNNKAVIRKMQASTHAVVFGSSGSSRTNFLETLAVDAIKGKLGLIYIGVNAIGSASRLDNAAKIEGRPGLQIMDLNGAQGKNWDQFKRYNVAWIKKVILTSVGDICRDARRKPVVRKVFETVIDLMAYKYDSGQDKFDALTAWSYFDFNTLREASVDADVPDEIKSVLSEYTNGFLLSPNEDRPKGSDHDRFVRETKKIKDMLFALVECPCDFYRANPFELIVERNSSLIINIPDSDVRGSHLGRYCMAMLYHYLSENNSNKDLPPVRIIIDGCSHYLIDAIAVLSAQARAFNLQLIYADDNYRAFSNSNHEQAMGVVANCQTRIFLDEDSNELIENITGKSVDQLTYNEAHVLRGELLEKISLDKR